MAASTMSAQPQSSVFPKSHVGFDSITSQIEKKLLKRGFQFNVICVGMFSHLQSHLKFNTSSLASTPANIRVQDKLV
jgi:hypothetical protein